MLPGTGRSGNTIKSSWKKAREGKSRSITFRGNNSGFKGGRREVSRRGGWHGEKFLLGQMESCELIFYLPDYNTRDATIDGSWGNLVIVVVRRRGIFNDFFETFSSTRIFSVLYGNTYSFMIKATVLTNELFIDKLINSIF